MLFVFSLSGMAQGINVSGTVVDDAGDPLIGASVMLKGQGNVGTVTDIDGNFQLNVPSEKSVLVFSYQGMTVADMAKLRNELKKTDSEIKIYKNTLAKRAFEDVNLKSDEIWEGPNAILFGKELLEPIKVLSNAAKDNDNIEIRTGFADGKMLTLDEIKTYASIPSKETMLTQISVGLMQYVKNVAIGLDLYAKKLEENN